MIPASHRRLALVALLVLVAAACGRRSQSDEGFAAYPEGTYNGAGESAQNAGDTGTDTATGGLDNPTGADTIINSSATAGDSTLSGSEAEDALTPPPPGTCGGLSSLNACWYLAAEEQSCNDVCEDHYGYDERTDTLVGSRGNDNQCKQIAAALVGPIEKGVGQEILDGLKNQFLPFLNGLDIASEYKFERKDVARDFNGSDDDLQFAYSPGCTVHKGPKGDYALIVRHYGVTTNPDDGAFGTQRVCACKG